MSDGFEIVGEARCFDGVQGIYSHASSVTGTTMRFAVYRPAEAAAGPLPVLWFLSGLTCTEENFVAKAGAQRYAAEHGLILVAPDTSPRGTDFPGENDAYDFGSGAGFYVDATEPPWEANYRMYSYIVDELPALVDAHFPIDFGRQGIMGHSMGGHGALTIALKNPDRFASVSAFAPIAAPMHCPWGQKALAGYLGSERAAWRAYDATALIADGHRCPHILVDQGEGDDFLATELLPDRLREACRAAGQPLELRLRPGYDHSYHFIASFVGEHIAHHAAALSG